MTPQFNILTGMKSGVDVDGGLVLNYFYKTSKKFVEDNFLEAEKMYKKVFKSFLSAWYVLYQHGEISHIPPKEWETLKI